MDTSYKYWAFISYSHADEKWAEWLQHSLETYRLAKPLVGKPHEDGVIPERLHPVFRDRSELSGAHCLSEAIASALAVSGYLIVICSPRSANSAYVEDEIFRFKKLGREERILCLIVDGDPNRGADDHCFSPALTRRFEGGEFTDEPTEPVAADVRPGKDDRRSALLKIIAGIIGVDLDHLMQRDLRRRRKRQRALVLAGVFATLFFSLFYLGLSDARVNLPASETLRRTLDRYSLTVFRPVISSEELSEQAGRMRQRLVVGIVGQHDESGIFISAMGNAKPAWGSETDIWTSSQFLTALNHAPETNREHGSLILRAIRSLLEHPQAVHREGVLVGWQYRYQSPPQAEIALWLATAVHQSLTRDDIFSDTQRAELRKLARQIHATFIEHRRSEVGGWTSFRGVEGDVNTIQTYPTVLALQALLARQRGGHEEELQMDGQTTRQWIAELCNLLVDAYEEPEGMRGWQALSGDLNLPLDGLTLQVYATLLEAESQTEFLIPTEIARAASEHFIACGYRNPDFPLQSIELDARVIGEDGKLTFAGESARLDWYCWAIKGSALWLRRTKGGTPMPEQTRGVERALGNMVVGIGDVCVEDRLNTYGWQAAELAYCLSYID